MIKRKKKKSLDTMYQNYCVNMMQMKGLVENEVNVIVSRVSLLIKANASHMTYGFAHEVWCECTKPLQNKNTEQNLGVWCR